MKPETRFWHWLEGALPEGDYSRVEPPPTPGIPDVNYCVYPTNTEYPHKYGVDGWIELKVAGRIANYPFRGTHKGLRQSQRRWMKRRLRYHGRVFIFVAVKRDVYIFDAIDAPFLTEDTTLLQFHARAIAVLPRIADDEFKHQVRFILTEWPRP